MKRVEGKGGIWAEVVADSINIWGNRVTTFRLHYHRYIHSEFMTHRMVSKNASSSRAIPVQKQLETIETYPAMPIHWGLNEPGMQANEEGHVDLHVDCSSDGDQWEKTNFRYSERWGDQRNDEGAVDGRTVWVAAAENAVAASKVLWQNGHGHHKQIVNRIAEPFTFMNVVATATDWENFFWLRCHKDAQPEIAELARVMYEAREASEPKTLRFGEWHVPYVDSFRDSEGMIQYCDDDAEEIYTLEEAQKISASCCAQASYRKLDQSLDKALMVYDRLVGGVPLHASPFEHPCTPFDEGVMIVLKQTYLDVIASLQRCGMDHEAAEKQARMVHYSANFRGWTQLRRNMDNENQMIPFAPE